MSGGGLRERLGRLTGAGARKSDSAAAVPVDLDAPAAEPDRAPMELSIDPESAEWAKLGFTLRPGPEGACLTRDVIHGAAHRHGLYTVRDFAAAGAALARLDPAGRDVAPEKLLFLDTETTGLGQGAGNVPFLIGVGWWARDGFTVRQYIIRHPGEEAAMLAALAELLPSFTHLATYNGRSFDWPLVKNRFILHRMRLPRDPAHFDFLYPSRSLWRTTMPSVRLGAVEEAKLGVFRQDDVPGAMAPELYFRYLAERDVSLLAGVVRHNETDIVTLLTLATHFGRLLLRGSGESFGAAEPAAFEDIGAAELLRLALWYERLGFEEDACSAMRELSGRPAAEASGCWSEAALFYKRRKRWAEAIRLWRHLAEGGNGRRVSSIEPYVELAIAFEHRVRDIDAALYWTDAAVAALERRLPLALRAGDDVKLREQIAELRRRKDRLARKRGAGGLF